MALQSSEGPYKIQAWIDNKYKPLIIRGRALHTQSSKSSFGIKRRAGCCNIDLWLDSSLYPVDPSTGKRPKIESPRELLEFVGEGENGFLGYVKKLESMSGGTSALVSEKEIEISVLRGRIDELIHRSCHDSLESQSQIQTLRDELLSMQSTMCTMQCNYEVRVQNLSAEIIVSQELQARLIVVQELHDQRVREIEASHKQVLSNVVARLKTANSELKKKQGRLDCLVKTPFGYRSQIRNRRDLCTLSPNGGHAKATRRLARLMVAPATTRKIQQENAIGATHKRLCGSKSMQEETGRIFGSILSQTEVHSLLKLPNMSPIGIKMANQYLEKVGQAIGPHEVLQVCDESGITLDGFSKLYKKFKGGIKQAGSGLRLGCLPNPHQVQLLRKELNSKFEDLVGKPMNIHNIYEVKCSSKSLKSNDKLLQLDEFNNLFLDIEAVQRTMIRLYRINLEEIQDSPLIFVLKMDEAEIVHNEKLERISITLMNRALNPDITEKSDKYFSVQSEREIFPIGCFRLPKENHEVLKWVFNQTRIPTLIEAQNSGQLLEVDGVGSFRVQWHLAADLKTIKALYGLSSGANARHCCIYCMQQKIKVVTAMETHARSVATKRTPFWEGGVFAANIPSKPISLDSSTERWKPIFKIPLVRVHICTLHALNRICEKMLHLHFQYVWTIRDKRVQKQAIEDIENILSSTGMHGGAVKIFKDQELSGSSNNVPNKPSLSGAKSAKLFQKSTLPKSSDRVWRDIVLAERDTSAGGAHRRDRMACWAALERLLPYFTGLTLSEELRSNFSKDANEFGELFVKVYGEHHVTHYLHVFIKHATWFVKEYGSLSVWSCQGMEFSHHAAKAAYHRHTAHGGGKHKKNPFLETYEHWFRIIQHRFRNNEIKDNELHTSDEQTEAIILKRREASVNSSAATHAALWRETCDRVGSRWVPKAHVSPHAQPEVSWSV